jgi:hypothetical protein
MLIACECSVTAIITERIVRAVVLFFLDAAMNFVGTT